MTYEYECSRCGTFEVEQKISDPPLTVCPRAPRDEVFGDSLCCGGEVRRLVSSPPAIFKGKGWAKDGYR